MIRERLNSWGVGMGGGLNLCWETAGLLGSRDCRAQPDKLEAVSQSAALNIACSHTVAGIELVSPEPAHMLIREQNSSAPGRGGRKAAGFPRPQRFPWLSQYIHAGLHFSQPPAPL